MLLGDWYKLFAIEVGLSLLLWKDLILIGIVYLGVSSLQGDSASIRTAILRSHLAELLKCRKSFFTGSWVYLYSKLQVLGQIKLAFVTRPCHHFSFLELLADFHGNTRREDRSLDPISRFDEELLIGSLHIGFLDAVGDRRPPSFSIERCCSSSLLIFLIFIIVLFRVIIILTQLVGKVNCDDVEPGVDALHLVYYLLDPPLLSIYLLLAIRDQEEALAVLSGATKSIHHVKGDFKCIQYGSALNFLLLFLVHWCIRLYIPEEG